MKLTKKERESIARSKVISDIIGDKLKAEGDKSAKKVDLSKIAKELSERRQGVQGQDEDEIGRASCRERV